MKNLSVKAIIAIVAIASLSISTIVFASGKSHIKSQYENYKEGAMRALANDSLTITADAGIIDRQRSLHAQDSAKIVALHTDLNQVGTLTTAFAASVNKIVEHSGQ